MGPRTTRARVEDEPRVLAGRAVTSGREDRRAGGSAEIVTRNDGADFAMLQHGLTHPVGSPSVAAGAVEHQPDRSVLVSLQEFHDLPTGPVRQPAGDEQVSLPCPHGSVTDTAERVGDPVRERDEQQDADHDCDPDDAAEPLENRLS